MRLPWPFGRSSAAPDETEPNTDPAAGPPPALAPPITAPPTGAWSTLPPIQRVSGDPPVVAPARAFLNDVPGANPLPPIVGQLGHDVTPLAPAGLVAAPVHAVPSLTSDASLVDRPVQRRAAEGVAASVAASAPPPVVPSTTPPPLASPAARASSSDLASGAASASVAGASGPVADEPVRHLSVVADAAVAPAPARSLTKAGSWTPPAATADRPLVHRTNVQASERASDPTAPGPAQATAAPAGAQAAGAATHASPPDVSIGAGETQRRRPGLGAPLASAPTTAVQRSAAASSPAPGPALGLRAGGPSLPLNPTVGAAPLHTTVQRRGAAARAAATAGADAPAPMPLERPGSRQAPFVGSPQTSGLPSLPVVSRSSTAQADGSAAAAHDAGDDADHGESEPRVRAVASGASMSTLPLAPMPTPTPEGRDREAAKVTIQRAPGATGSTPASATTASAPERRPLVGARPLRPTAAPDASMGTGAVSPPADGVLSGQAPSMPFDAGLGNALTFPAGSIPALQRSADSKVGSSPAASGGAPRDLPALPAVQTSRRDAPAMALARPTAGAAMVGTTPGTATIHFPAATSGVIPGITAAPASPPVVQTQPAAAPASAPVLAPTITANVQRIDGSPPPVPEPEEGRSESDLEELARALFPKFQRQLRMEYVYEREARGLPFDT